MNPVEAAPTCPACDHDLVAARRMSATDRFFGTPGTFTYGECGNCGSLVAEHLRTPAEDIATWYANYYTHAPSRRSPRRRPATRDVAHLADLAPGRVLDIGCGNGDLLSDLRATGWETYGVDLDPAAADTARGRIDHVRIGGAEAARGFGVAFDAIVMRHVIEHVAEPSHELAVMASMLAPGGRVVIVTPNARSIGRRLFGKRWRGLEPPRHLVVLSPAALTELLQRAFPGQTVRMSFRHALRTMTSASLQPDFARVSVRWSWPLARAVSLVAVPVAAVVRVVAPEHGDEMTAVVECEDRR